MATTRLNYDSRHRVNRIELPLSALDVGYDAVGLPVNLAYSDATALAYAYDDADRLTSATGVALAYDDANRVVGSNGLSLGRDAGGRIASLTFEAGKTVSYGYDRRNRVVSVSDWAGATTRLSYDDAWRLTGIARPNGVVTAYSYDAADRLTRIVESGGPATLSSIALTRDAAGQIEEAIRDVPLEAAPVQATRPQTYNDADQIAGYSYDAMGRLTAGGGRTYRWDLASRLTSYTEGQSGVSFTYDALGSRLTRAQAETARNYLWNYGLGLPSISVVKDGESVTRYYVHTPGGLLLYSLEAGTHARRFYHYDEIGSTLFLTDDAAAVTDSYAYTAYGQLTAATGSTDNPFTYVGAYGVMREPSTSLYYARARWYDGTTGRFLSRDPLGVDLLNPGSTNPYLYARANPLRFVDPSGLDTEIIAGPPVPGQPGVPRLSMELLTNSFPRAAPGDQGLRTFRVPGDKEPEAAPASDPVGSTPSSARQTAVKNAPAAGPCGNTAPAPIEIIPTEGLMGWPNLGPRPDEQSADGILEAIAGQYLRYEGMAFYNPSFASRESYNDPLCPGNPPPQGAPSAK
ncbi:MAG: RHS repeat-associated core domain-containing protein [Acidobacteria bacterium]|nr:RHS repeat-associated core domain-containing protein [Acidobacteriota bacterium]